MSVCIRLLVTADGVNNSRRQFAENRDLGSLLRVNRVTLAPRRSLPV